MICGILDLALILCLVGKVLKSLFLCIHLLNKYLLRAYYVPGALDRDWWYSSEQEFTFTLHVGIGDGGGKRQKI